MNHLTEEQLVLYHYGDAAESASTASIEEHLHACAACEADLMNLRRTLSAVDALPVPDRGDGYGSEVWARIHPSLDRRSEPWWQPLQALFVPRRLVFAGGVLVLMVAAFVAGRFVPALQPAAPDGQAAGEPAANPQLAAVEQQQVRERILLIAVGDHLERSQVALVELVNNPAGPHVDISDERQRARELVSENRLYRQTALTTGEQAVASVLDDLGRVLVEIANSPARMSKADFEKMRTRIEQQGIIFKVRVFGEYVREGRVPSPVDARVRG